MGKSKYNQMRSEILFESPNTFIRVINYLIIIMSKSIFKKIRSTIKGMFG